MEDQIAEKVKQSLSKTPWAVRKLDRISGGNANFTYRGHLQDVEKNEPSTVFIKHGENFAALNTAFTLDVTRSEYEWFMLSALSGQTPAVTKYFQVRTPKVLGSLENTKIMEDLPDATTLKAYLSRYGAHLDPQIAHELGVGLGRWLANFHTWIDADTSEARNVRDKIKDNPMVPLREGLYIGNYEASMAKFPDEIAWPTKELFKEIESAVLAMYRTRDGGIHGDFWTGNMIIKDELVESSPLELDRESSNVDVFIVDFEVTQLGTRAQDFAQCLAELWMVHHFHGAQAPLHVMHGFAEGYGITRDSQLALQIAMHFGIHVVVIPWRYNTGWKSGEPLIDCMRFGNQCLIKGFESDVDWFLKGPLGFLFG